MTNDKTTEHTDSLPTENDLVSQLLSVSRYVVAETLMASAVHGMRHRIHDAHRKIHRRLNDPKIRSNDLLFSILTELDGELTEIERDIDVAFRFSRDTRIETSHSCEAHAEISKTAELWTAYLSQKKCKLEFRLRAYNTHIEIPPGDFQEIIAALIVNSVEAHSTLVSITTNDKKDWRVSEIFTVKRAMEVLVEDNGIGLTTNLPEMLFEPTYTTKSKYGGVGLGLFIARSIARRAGGELSYIGRSIKGGGAAFSLALPIRERKL